MPEDWKIIWSPASAEERAAWKSILNGTAIPKESTVSLEHMLCRAIFSRDIELIQLCLSHGAKLDSWVHESIGRNCTFELLQIFVPAGLDINYNVDRIGGYLTIAVRGDNPKFVDYLLEHGADPNKNPLGDSFPALSLAVQDNQIEMVEMLIRHGAQVNGMGALGAAAKYRRFNMMELLFRHGADINDNAKEMRRFCFRPRPKERTALHEAALEGNADVVTYLLERGANPDVHDLDGQTPLMLAQANGHQEVAGLLETKQAKAA
ncbi:ankyrin repeat-containing domain protein [Aspergillus bertholletiae]|uniref:Ankyrin repeat-containing domain protein n=1 Tax=Aspergillus bertholletiae TaxID=1226010 RepID=A0A5N7AS82_9EURO|nr:ankyrin repeat-containing domain protein [Aspergillus bertholletiae]